MAGKQTSEGVAIQRILGFSSRLTGITWWQPLIVTLHVARVDIVDVDVVVVVDVGGDDDDVIESCLRERNSAELSNEKRAG